jgi:hypothetical protein
VRKPGKEEGDESLMIARRRNASASGLPEAANRSDFDVRKVAQIR